MGAGEGMGTKREIRKFPSPVGRENPTFVSCTHQTNTVEAVGHKETTIAVLPFRILGDPDPVSPIIDGFTEDLILNFSKFIGLSVLSPYSTQDVHGRHDRETLSKFNLDYLVCGSFRPMDFGFRIGVQLIRNRDDKVVFAGNHDESLDTLLRALDSIVQQIVNVLKGQIDHDLLSHSYKKESVERAVYEDWLLGMNELKKGTQESDLSARAHFEAALKRDPNFARAHTGMSLTYFNEWSCQLWDRWEISKKGAHEHALKAIALDGNDYVSLAVLGRTFLYLGEHEKSLHLLEKSLQMNPNDADNLILVAQCLVWLGHVGQAQQLFERARKLNPLQPQSFLPTGALIFFEQGDYAQAVALGEKVSDLYVWTDFPALLAAAYYQLSQFDKMEAYWAKYLAVFKKNIKKGKDASPAEAVAWLQEVNPFKVKSRMEPFWNHIRGTERRPAPLSDRKETTATGSFVRKGEIWELDYMGVAAAIKHCKGLYDIARLLEASEKSWHCTVLMGSVLESKGIPLVDGPALREYRSRLQALQGDLDLAMETGQLGEAEALREEYDGLLHHLARVMGRSHGIRSQGASHDKARSATTWRIRSAIKKIDRVHPKLAKHLSRSIRTGNYCSYRPETPHQWSL